MAENLPEHQTSLKQSNNDNTTNKCDEYKMASKTSIKNQLNFSNNYIGTFICNDITTEYEDPHPKKNFFNMQEYIISFTGRDDDILKIDESIAKNRMTVVSGFGGIGKTELVRYYAWKNETKFEGNVVWINAESETTLDEIFKRLADNLKIPVQQNSQVTPEIIRRIYGVLNSNKCLIIFDNAVNRRKINVYLPYRQDTNVSVLITSQNSEWPEANIINLNVMTTEDATKFLKNNLEVDCNTEHITELTEKLQNLPLALQQAVACINYKVLYLHENFSVRKYIQEFEEKRLFNLLYDGSYPFPETVENFYDKTVFTALSLTVDLIKSTSQYPDLSLEILHICCFLEPENIPKIFFMALQENEDKLNVAIRTLIKYSLLQEFYVNNYLNVQEKLWKYNIHRLVQISFRYLKNPEGFCPEILKKSLTVAIEKELSISPHCASIIDFIKNLSNVDYEFYFKDCPNKRVLLFHFVFYDFEKAAFYLVPNMDARDCKEGLNSAISKNSLGIVRLICSVHKNVVAMHVSGCSLSNPLILAANMGRKDIKRALFKNVGAEHKYIYDFFCVNRSRHSMFGSPSYF